MTRILISFFFILQKYEELFAAQTLSVGEHHYPGFDTNCPAAAIQSDCVQNTADKMQGAASNSDTKVSNEINIPKISETICFDSKILNQNAPSENVQTIQEEKQESEKIPATNLLYLPPRDTSQKINGTVTEVIKPLTTKAIPTTSKSRTITLPQRKKLLDDIKLSKPSASVEPFNYVKFEGATGETFYFSKYFKLPPNLPSPKPSNKRKRIRTAFTDAHLYKLEEEYAKCRFIKRKDRKLLAHALNLTETNIKLWYQNRRSRDRIEMIDLDSDDDDNTLSHSTAPSMKEKKALTEDWGLPVSSNMSDQTSLSRSQQPFLLRPGHSKQYEFPLIRDRICNQQFQIKTEEEQNDAKNNLITESKNKKYIKEEKEICYDVDSYPNKRQKLISRLTFEDEDSL